MVKSLILERNWPWLFALAVGGFFAYKGFSLPQKDSVLGASLNFGAIITGFLGTMKAILMGFQSKTMDRIRESGYIEDLTAYVGQAVWASLGFSLIAFLGFFLDHEKEWYGVLLLGAGTFTFACFVRLTIIMLKLLKLS